MGRITNAIGLRLGTQITWKCTGISTKKYNCINYNNLNIYLGYLIKTGNIFDNQYLIAQIQVIQGKANSVINIFFYMKNILPFLVQKTQKVIISKLLKKYLLLAAYKKNKKLRRVFLVKKKLYKKKTLYKKLYINKNLINMKDSFDTVSLSKVISMYLLSYDTIYPLEVPAISKFLNKLFKIMQKEKNKKLVIKVVLLTIIKLLNLSDVVINNFFRNSLDFLKVSLYTQRVLLRKFLIARRVNTIKKNIFLISDIKNKKKLIKNNLLFIFFKLFNFNFTNLPKVNTNFTYRFFYKQIVQNTKLKVLRYTYKILNVKNNGLKISSKNLEKLLFKRKFVTAKNYNNNKFLIEFLCIEKTILQIIKSYTNEDIICNFNFVSNFNYTAQLLVTYICIKLKQKFTINQIVRPLSKFLQKLIKKNYLYGYKFQLKGRFTRKQRATKLTLKGGAVPLATINMQIDYFSDIVSLKDGVGGVKIWLHKTKKLQNTILSLKN